MAFYESIFIARQELGEKEIEKTIESFKGILEKNSADLVDTELWGLRNLAYKIEKNKKGHYVVLKISGNGEA
ncbi:MAG: 30S ribosomal protein S6, partial [Alphaproteobacteria bacterium]